MDLECFQSRGGADIHPNVTNLTLLLQDVLSYEESVVGGIRLAAQCFPSVEEAVIIGNRASTAISVLRIDGRTVFPKLHSIALGSTPVPLHIHELLEAREKAEVPLRRIYLPENILTTQPQLELQRIKHKVEVVFRDIWLELKTEGLYYSSVS